MRIEMSGLDQRVTRPWLACLLRSGKLIPIILFCRWCLSCYGAAAAADRAKIIFALDVRLSARFARFARLILTDLFVQISCS